MCLPSETSAVPVELKSQYRAFSLSPVYFKLDLEIPEREMQHKYLGKTERVSSAFYFKATIMTITPDSISRRSYGTQKGSVCFALENMDFSVVFSLWEIICHVNSF